MTTIAVDKQSMACDLQFTYGGHMKFKGLTKIIEVPKYTAENIFKSSKAFVGFCGSVDEWPKAMDYLMYLQNYEKPVKIKELELLALTDNKDIYHATTLQNWMRIDHQYFSIGSGCHYASGALAAGKTPLEAVKIAAKFDPKTGMGFKQYKL